MGHSIELIRAGYSPTAFAKVTSLSRSNVYNRLKDGTIKSARIGGRIVIPVSEVDRLLSVATSTN